MPSVEQKDLLRARQKDASSLESQDSAEVRMPSSFDLLVDGDEDEFREPKGFHKVLHRCKEEPLVLLGCAATCAALIGAGYGLRNGNKALTQRMFRYRVGAQFATLAFVVGGALYYGNDRALRKQEYAAQQQEKAKARQAAWIRDLEARDALVQDRNRQLAEKKRQMQRDS